MPDSLEYTLAHPLLRESLQGVVVVDEDHILRYLNPAAERMFGHAADDAVGQSLNLLLPPDVRARHPSYVAQFAHSSETTRRMGERTEIAGLKANGTQFPAEASITRLELSGQTYLVAIVNDLTERKALEAQRQWLAEILEATPDFVAMADPEGNVLYQNQAAQTLLGSAQEGWHVRDAHPSGQAEVLLNEAFPAAARDGVWEGETTLCDEQGREVPLSQIVLAHYNHEGEIRYFSTIGRDLRPFQRTQAELRQRSRALNQSADMVWITDTTGVVVYVNTAFVQLTGCDKQAAIGQPVFTLLGSGKHDMAFYEGLLDKTGRDEPHRNTFTMATPDGDERYIDETITPVHDDSGQVTHFITTARDVTPRLELEERLRDLAYFDQLTGLPNRAQLEEQLANQLPQNAGETAAQAVILMDLDRFKNLNDTLGHPAGDDLLKQVAGRLRTQLRPTDVLARLSGDEFVCLLDPAGSAAAARETAEQLLAVLRQPFEVQNHSFSVTASLGICLVPEDGADASTLLQHADTAMFEAKGAGGNQYRFFSHGLSKAAAERFFVEEGVRRALAEDGVHAHFQPVVDAASGAVVGAEALARCWFPEEGWVSPGRFIPVAEQTGLVHELGEQILDQALAQFRHWQEAGHALQRIAVNLSPVQLESPTLPQRIGRLIQRHGVDPAHLELEITEEAAMREEEQTLDRIHQLQELGVEIALDDFGTGFSSPANLRRFPANRMKIDRTFIRGIDHDPDNQTILRSLLVLAEGFGFRVTAEGVETAAEAEYLRRMFCQEVQGFLYGRPTAAGDFGPTFLEGAASPTP